MDSYNAVLSPTAKWTRLLVSHGSDELLRAILPPPTQVLPALAREYLVSLAPNAPPEYL
jgi:hypothetical protein